MMMYGGGFERRTDATTVVVARRRWPARLSRRRCERRGRILPPPQIQFLIMEAGEKLPNQIEVSADGMLYWQGKEYRCALGSGGIRADKKEGDGATPSGVFPLRRVFYRSDRISKPATQLPVQALLPDDGWCDDVQDSAYNTHIKLPHPDSHEKLYRDDEVYDVIIPIGYNDAPAIPGNGSAIFIHVARPTYTPTAGCIALAKEDLLEILKTLTPEVRIHIISTRTP